MSVYAALAAAQGEFPEIAKSNTARVKTRNDGEYTYNYADLSDVLAALRPILSKHGIALVQWTEITEHSTDLCTQLVCGESEGRVSRFALPVDRADAQQVGSLLSYHRRYQTCLVCGVQPAEEDDDGERVKGIKHRPAPANVDTSTGEVRPPSPRVLGARMNSHGWKTTEMKRQFVTAVVGETRTLDDCNPDELHKVADALNRVDAGEVPSFSPAGCVLAWQAETEPF